MLTSLRDREGFASPQATTEPATERFAAEDRARGAPGLPRALPPWSVYPLLAFGYLALAQVGYTLLEPATRLAVWWPPSGLYLAVLLLQPRRRWPALVAAALPAAVLGSILAGRAPGLAVWLFAGNTLEAVAGAWLVQRIGGRPAGVSTLRGAVALVVVPAAVGAVIAPLVLAAQVLTVGGGARAVWVFWAGASLGTLIVAPLIVAWTEPRADAPSTGSRRWEALALSAVLALSLAALSGKLGAVWAHEIVLVLPVVWAALRFGPRGATLATAAAAFEAARLLSSASPLDLPAGAFAAGGVRSLQLHLAVVGATGLLVAAASEERRRAAQALARSRDLLGSFFASAPTGMFIKDHEHRAVALSWHFGGMLGQPVESLLGKTVAETFPGPLGEQLLELERAAVRGGQPVRHELQFGDQAFLDIVFPIPRSNGPPNVGGLAIEVTDRVRAEAALRESEARLRLVEAALDRASDAVSVFDEEGRCVWANAASAHALERTKESLVGVPIHELQPGTSPVGWRAYWVGTAARGVLVRQEPLPAPGGKVIPGEVASAIVEFSGRRYLVRSARDVSDRRRAEATARLAGLGTVAAGVAHEVNNPLSYVLANLAWLADRIESSRPEDLGAPIDEARRVIAEARDGALRVRDIVAQLRVFARPDEKVGLVDVRAAARSAVAIVGNDLRHRAQLAVRLEDVPPVRGNETRLAQVALNLLTNAGQAIPAGHADRNVILVCVRPGEGADEVVLEVSDTGPGIPPEVRSRLFEPFYTTKPVGTGTGLGLFICHGIVAELGGRIEVESELGAGSTFRVVLPAAGETSAAPAHAPSPAPARRGRLLVLDDDERVAGALRRIVERDHDVEISTDPRGILERIRAGASWDVLFCDLMMPEMTGMEWFEEVSRARPALAERVVFITGGAFTDAARDFLERVPNARLDKPFVGDEVRSLVAERLSGG